GCKFEESLFDLWSYKASFFFGFRFLILPFLYFLFLFHNYPCSPLGSVSIIKNYDDLIGLG
ncbi:MAG: hypothetical protein AAFO96_29435, partial [Bacteroidota bacterium]